MVWCPFFFLYQCPFLQNYTLQTASFSLVLEFVMSYLQCSDHVLKEAKCSPIVAGDLNCSLLSKKEKEKPRPVLQRTIRPLTAVCSCLEFVRSLEKNEDILKRHVCFLIQLSGY